MKNARQYSAAQIFMWRTFGNKIALAALLLKGHWIHWRIQDIHMRRVLGVVNEQRLLAGITAANGITNTCQIAPSTIVAKLYDTVFAPAHFNIAGLHEFTLSPHRYIGIVVFIYALLSIVALYEMPILTEGQKVELPIEKERLKQLALLQRVAVIGMLVYWSVSAGLALICDIHSYAWIGPAVLTGFVHHLYRRNQEYLAQAEFQLDEMERARPRTALALTTPYTK